LLRVRRVKRNRAMMIRSGCCCCWGGGDGGVVGDCCEACGRSHARIGPRPA
jgi:hypothetical protein